MNPTESDLLLTAAKAFARILQGVFALAGGIVLLMVPIIMLLSQGMLADFVDPKNLPSVAMFPIPGVGILLAMAVSLAALCLFFGKMHAIIRSVAEGDSFAPENAGRLGAMAWLLLVHEIAAVLVGELRAYLAGIVDGPVGNTIDYSPYDLDGLLIVLVLFILARVFRRGAVMRADLEGTV